jgi:hypothetical protein
MQAKKTTNGSQPNPDDKHKRRSPPGVAYAHSLRAGIESLYSDQVENWQRFWGRIQKDDYTFGMWTADAVRFWDGWLSGYSRLLTAPLRAVEGETVPVVGFVVDRVASANQVMELPVPAHRRIDSDPQATDLTGTAKLGRLKVVPTLDRERGIIEIRLNEVRKYKDDPAPSGSQATAVIFKQNTVLAQVLVIAA